MMKFSIRFPVNIGVLSLILALPVYAEPSTSGQDTQPDFRKASWGMTQEQVRATEPDQPAEIRQSNGEVILRFDARGAAELRGRLLYIFLDNKLVRAKYISDAAHDDPNDFIKDFAEVEPRLLETYGKPSTDRAIWENDLYQQERLAYLDQDRAHASDILPSDRFTGLSVSLGYLRMYTERTSARTRIVHALTGADSRIMHQIEYRSIDLEEFENTAIHQSGPRS